MSETQERPKEQWDVLIMLRSAPATLGALVAGLGEDRALTHQGEEWSIAEIVAHPVDGEWAWSTRLRRMATEDRPSMEMFPNADYSRASLASYARNRAEDIDYLESLAPELWSRPGRHEVWGDVDILWAARHLAAHDAEHFAQIARFFEKTRTP
jgi:hypothetical protein